MKSVVFVGAAYTEQTTKPIVMMSMAVRMYVRPLPIIKMSKDVRMYVGPLPITKMSRSVRMYVGFLPINKMADVGCCDRFGRGASLYRRSCSEDCGFDSHCRPGSFLRFNSRPIMYGAVRSLVLSWSWTRQPGFIFFWCLWIQLCNNLGQRLCAYNLP